MDLLTKFQSDDARVLEVTQINGLTKIIFYAVAPRAMSKTPPQAERNGKGIFLL